MIQLRRLNAEPFTLNAIMIEQIQSFPDTMITLTNGKKIIVQNPESEVIELVNSYYRKIGIQKVLNEVDKGSE
ncbi:flagellar protein FlbD [Virgibacillus natechei]|uniref:Flagellar protein FlbD n=1 Tax=Virgibacillus natechei TaxID=1216297 RepID=A0ABS4IDJ2_9BACI|nr:flagellar FlbD family protein [Virgibacillus natechei]MBP1968094.1 flagellar protein FlbD [Virgibacillus natechei]UZD14625.1 flagellar FlbD family protein [Virgibacillus natechei]